MRTHLFGVKTQTQVDYSFLKCYYLYGGIKMERSYIDKLNKWKNNKNRKPLLVTGVRQCGKTYLLDIFGKRVFIFWVNSDQRAR